MESRVDADAQYSLGILYDNGTGVAQDDTEAAKWFRLAADQGYAKAQNNLGVLYERGHGGSTIHQYAAPRGRHDLVRPYRGDRRALAAMSDRSLRDIGFTRYDAASEASKPFWHA